MAQPFPCGWGGVLGCQGSLWPDSEHPNPRLLELLAKCMRQGKAPAVGNLPGRLWKNPPNSSKKRRHMHLFRIPKEHSSRIHAHVTHSHAQPPLEGPGVLQTDKRFFIRSLEDRSSIDLECCHWACVMNGSFWKTTLLKGCEGLKQDSSGLNSESLGEFCKSLAVLEILLLRLKSRLCGLRAF